MANHVGQLLDHLSIEKAHFLGNSLGGHIALVYGKENLDRLQSLTLTGSSGFLRVPWEMVIPTGRATST